MSHDRTTRKDVPELFRSREDEESPRSDVEGSISEIVNEDTAQEDMHELIVLDGDEMEGDMVAAGDSVAIEVGLDVVGSCGHKIGDVVDIRPGYLVVEKGFFAPEDVYVPKDAVAKVDEHRITLNVTRETSEHSGWERDPDGLEDEDLSEDPDKRL